MSKLFFRSTSTDWLEQKEEARLMRHLENELAESQLKTTGALPKKKKPTRKRKSN